MREIIDTRISEYLNAGKRLDEDARGTIKQAAQMVMDCLKAQGRVYVAGNGGSAADAQHIASELAGRFLLDRRALACASLTTDSSLLTSLGNDLGFESIFSRQVEAYARRGDLVWLLSTSGNSPNILAAARSARQSGAQVLGFSGQDGGALAELCDLMFYAPASGSFAVQQIHQLAYHIICELVEAALA